MAVEAGTRVGRFLIHEYRGEGDLGQVFRACGPAPESVVAIKLLRIVADDEDAHAFERVARRLVALRHPNLVSALDAGFHEGIPFLVEQYVEGSSLRDRVRAGPVDPPEAVRLLQGIAAGVDHANASGLVHGSLKPGQVVLDLQGHPFVTDVGLASLRWPRPDRVPVAVSERTAAYTAPEVVTGGRPSPAADRYAFATMAYELLTGRTPFDGQRNERIDSPPAAPSTVLRSLGRAVDVVLLRGLDADPGQRWHACAEMVKALEEALHPAEPEPAATPATPVAGVATGVETEFDQVLSQGSPRNGPRAEVERVARRGPRFFVVAGSLTALLVGGCTAVAWMARQQSPVAVTLSSPTARRGDVLSLDARGLPPGQGGIVQLHSDPEEIGIFRADQSGGVRTWVTIPQGAESGAHEVGLCWDGGCHGEARLTITDQARPGSAMTSATGPLRLPSPPAHTPSPSATGAPASDLSTTGRAHPRASGPAAGPAGSTLSASQPRPAPGPSSRPGPGPAPSPTGQPTPTSTPSASPSPSPAPSPPPTPSPSPSPGG